MKPLTLCGLGAAVLGWQVLAGAQNLAVLHTFSPNTDTNLDGAGPEVGLVVSGDRIYGAAGGGANGSGTNNFGTVFWLNRDGSNFTVLHTFRDVSSSGGFPAVNVNADGFVPAGTLILAGDTLYGAAGAGGTNGSGTLFALATDGSAFTVLHTFATNVPPNTFAAGTNFEGAGPNSLVLAGGTLYGTADGGGTNGFGTIFCIKTNGADFSVLHTFKAADGKNPASILVVAGGTLYGATPVGGTNGAGTVFAIGTDGTGFKVLHTFAGGSTQQGPYLTGLLLSGSILFGTTAAGGANTTGLVFSLNTNGTAFTLLHSFGALSDTNRDGANPEGALALLGDTLYGAASFGGANRSGTVFCLATNGTVFNTLYAFTQLHVGTNRDGAHPESGVVLDSTAVYGTAYFGGEGNGTIFALPVAPTLTRLQLAGTNLLVWGINGLAGRNGCLLGAADPLLSFDQWSRLATNVLPGGASFSLTFTNVVNPTAAEQFYRLEVQ